MCVCVSVEERPLSLVISMSLSFHHLNLQLSSLEEERSCLSQSVEDLMVNKEALSKEVEELKEENNNLTNQLASSKSQVLAVQH